MSKTNAIDPSKTPVIENAIVRVRSTTPSRRRANRAFSRTPTDISAAEITEADLLALYADPLLVVEIVGDVPEVDGEETNAPPSSEANPAAGVPAAGAASEAAPHTPASERADSSTVEAAPSTEAAKPSPPVTKVPAGKAHAAAPAKKAAAKAKR